MTTRTITVDCTTNSTVLKVRPLIEVLNSFVH